MSSDSPRSNETLHPLSRSLGGDAAGRVIRPGAGGALLDRRFRLEDISALTEALVNASRGRIERLRGAAHQVEETLRNQAEESRARISAVIAAAEQQIEDRVRDTTRRSGEAIEKSYREGLEQGEREGFAKGYGEGLEKGLREGRGRAHEETRIALEERTATLVPALESLIEEFGREQRELRDSARQDLLELALEIARRIVRREVEIPPAVVVDTMHAAIDRIDARRGLVVEIHPDDRGAAEEFLSRVFGHLEAAESVTIVEHPERSRGGCRVRTECGSIDETIETQFELIEERLRGREGVQR